MVRASSGRPDVLGARSLRAVDDVEPHTVTLVEGPEPLGFDLAVVDEDVRAALALERQREQPWRLDDRVRRHAEIAPAGDGWAVRDLASTNGTKVNGLRIQGEQALADGATGAELWAATWVYTSTATDAALLLRNGESVTGVWPDSTS